MMSSNEMAFFPANFMLTHEQDHHQPPPSLSQILPSCTPQDYHGVASFLGKRSMSFSGFDTGGEEVPNNNGEDDLSDEESQGGGEKKRRLNMEQVKTLEKNFELGSKLEPERKMELARALGLQPRQIAIWFQNRRARWKTKQLEKDYDVLKKQFDAIKADNEALQAQNQKLHAEILALKHREPAESINLNKETEGSSSNRSENSSEFKLDMSRAPAIDSPLPPAEHHPIMSRQLFPPSSARQGGGGVVAQLIQNQTVECQKIDQNQMVKEESSSFTNMFCGIDDQSGFWPWLEQQPNFN